MLYENLIGALETALWFSIKRLPLRPTLKPSEVCEFKDSERTVFAVGTAPKA
jgi:hypothetical protein